MISNANIEYKIKQGADVCYIHFCSRTKTSGAFERYPVPNNTSSIFLNSGQSDWYLNGIPELGNLPQSIEKLEKICNDAGAKRIICIGASMGAFGAALYASRLNCELICFGTELHLNIHLGFSVADLKGVSSLSLMTERQPKRSLMVAGAASITDLVCASHFSREWSDASIIVLNDCGHESARRLKDLGLLSSLISSFEANENLKTDNLATFSNTALASMPTPRPDLFNSKTLEDLCLEMHDHMLANDRIRVASRLVGKKSYAAAIPFIRMFRNACGDIPEIILLEANALFRTNNADEALRLIHKIEKLPAIRHQTLSLKASILEKLNKLDESIALQKIIVREHILNPIYTTANSKIESFGSELK